MNTKQIALICITIIVMGAIVSACAYTIMDRQIKLQEKQLNQTNNTKVINNTTVEVVEKETQDPKALGYKSDGSPMYSYAEIDNYVQSKYGQGSGWHLQDNGYVDLDKAGYTNDGRKL